MYIIIILFIIIIYMPIDVSGWYLIAGVSNESVNHAIDLVRNATNVELSGNLVFVVDPSNSGSEPHEVALPLNQDWISAPPFHIGGDEDTFQKNDWGQINQTQIDNNSLLGRNVGMWVYLKDKDAPAAFGSGLMFKARSKASTQQLSFWFPAVPPTPTTSAGQASGAQLIQPTASWTTYTSQGVYSGNSGWPGTNNAGIASDQYGYSMYIQLKFSDTGTFSTSQMNELLNVFKSSASPMNQLTAGTSGYPQVGWGAPSPSSSVTLVGETDGGNPNARIIIKVHDAGTIANFGYCILPGEYNLTFTQFPTKFPEIVAESTSFTCADSTQGISATSGAFASYPSFAPTSSVIIENI